MTSRYLHDRCALLDGIGDHKAQRSVTVGVFKQGMVMAGQRPMSKEAMAKTTKPTAIRIMSARTAVGTRHIHSVADSGSGFRIDAPFVPATG
jgi:hypothetical protein